MIDRTHIPLPNGVLYMGREKRTLIGAGCAAQTNCTLGAHPVQWRRYLYMGFGASWHSNRIGGCSLVFRCVLGATDVLRILLFVQLGLLRVCASLTLCSTRASLFKPCIWGLRRHLLALACITTFNVPYRFPYKIL